VSQHLTADEILYVAAGCRTVDLQSLSLVVVTGAHAPAPTEPHDWPFTPGEILIVQHGRDATRELLGTRDTEQWDTRALSYITSDVEQAIALAGLVRGGAERGMWEWDGKRWYRSRDQAASIERLNSIGGDPAMVFVGDTDAGNTWGMDVCYPGKYAWPVPATASAGPVRPGEEPTP
jgi:hypothetical protein